MFSPDTLRTLRGKSGESLRQMLGDKTLRQTMMSSMTLINEISQIETPYTDLLEQLAIQMVTDAYPIINYANIKIDAKILRNLEVQHTDNGDDEEGEEDDNEEPQIPNIDINAGNDIPPTVKRRIINGITHGAAIRGAFGYLLFREYLDNIDDSLVEKYRELLKNTFGVYDSDEAIALMLMMLAQGSKIEGGTSEAEYDEGGEDEEPGFKITARALNFPFLVHEIVKGLYEILSLQGFGADREQNNAIVKKVDKIENEPEDLRYGKFIYDAINDLYNNSEYDDVRIRELLFTEIYKLDDADFMSFIQNAINNRLTPAQQRWANDKMSTIAGELRRDDLPDDF
jgi:hypothetical protein